MNQIKKRYKVGHYLVLVTAALLGAVGGYLYYRFIGCTNGTCAITSSPYISTIYGSVIGLLLGTLFAPNKSKDKEAQNG